MARLGSALYRRLNSVGKRMDSAFGADITRLLVVRTQTLLGSLPSADADAGRQPVVRCVPGDELQSLANLPGLDLDGQSVAAVHGGQARCYMCFGADGHPVAQDFVAFGQVDPMHNSGGSGFSGIGLDLPANAAYVFKAWVAPDQRGTGLHRHVLRHVAQSLAGENIEWLVTTADWSNKASLSSFLGLGFMVRGCAMELKLGGRHRYRLPDPVLLCADGQVGAIAGTQASTQAQAVRLRAPGSSLAAP